MATGSRQSVNDAYKAKKNAFSVSVASVYNKLNGVETEVSRQMIRQTTLRLIANARAIADLYLRRWTVEKAFHELDQALNGEIKTLGYPGAALLSFCVALLAYNVIGVVKSAMAAVHGAEGKREDLSGYDLAGELAAAYHGMMIAVPPTEWTRHFAKLNPTKLACILKTLAAHVSLDRFRKNVRSRRC